MSTISVSNPVGPLSEERVHGPRLVGGWRIVGISAWAVIWLMSLAAFVAATAIWYRWDSTPAGRLPQFFPDVTPDTVAFYVQYQAGIRQLGMSLAFYAGFFATLRLLAGIPYFILSILVIRRRSDRLMAVAFALFLPVAGAAGRWMFPNWQALTGPYPWTQPLVQLMFFILDMSVLLFYTLPDGRFVPRWTRWVALAAVLMAIVRDFFPNSALNPDHLPGLLGNLYRVFVLFGIIALVIRYRRYADAVQKQQIKWIVFGAALLTVIYFAEFGIYQFFPAVTGHGLFQTPFQLLIRELLDEPSWYVGQILFVAGIGLAVFRYRLWDIDLVINRVLVYGSLTVLTMAVYLAAAGSLAVRWRMHYGTDPVDDYRRPHPVS